MGSKTPLSLKTINIPFKAQVMRFTMICNNDNLSNDMRNREIADHDFLSFNKLVGRRC